MIVIGSTSRSGSTVDLLTAALFLPSPLSAPAPFFGALYPLNFPAWSLLFELIANAWLGMMGARVSSRLLGTFVLASAIAVAIAMLVTGDALGGGIDWQTSYIGLIRVSFSFSAGVLVFRIWEEHKPPYSVPPLFIGMALLAIMIARPSTHFESACIGGISLAIFLVIIWFGASSKPGAFIAGRCSWLGAISYAVYILHVPISVWVVKIIEKLLHFTPDVTSWPWGASFIILIIVVADMADRLDGPARRFLISLIAERDGSNITSHPKLG